MAALSPDLDASVAFLRAVHPTGPWCLVTIEPDLSSDDQRKVRRGEFRADEEPRLRAWLADQAAGQLNVYFTSNLPRLPFTTHRKEAVEALRTLHVDVDLSGAADDEELSAELLARFRAMSPPPTVTVFTGGGYQALWLLTEVLPATEAQVARVEARNVALCRELRGDNCQDVGRLLRLPGSVNALSKRKRAKGRQPALARVVDAAWARRLDLDADPVPRLPDGLLAPSSADAPETAGLSDASSGVFDALPASLRRLIKTGDASSWGGDRSKLVWFVLFRLLRLRWEDEHVAALLLDRGYGVSAHCLDQKPTPDRYVARQLARAREHAARDYQRSRAGAILADSPANVEKALDELGVRLSYDAFSDRTWLNGAGPLRRYDDAGDKVLWTTVRDRFEFLPRRDVWDATVVTRARRASYHPVLDYLARVQPTWDGVERLGSPGAVGWLTRYGQAPDTAYVRAVGRLTLVAAVRRVRQPGCKFDEMLLLVNPDQGTNKSSAVRTLAVRDEWFNDYVPLGEVGREVIEHVRGFWIIESSELAGLRTRELEKIKAFCSRQHDRGRMSYDRIVSDVPRSCIFIGTTNSVDLFTDLSNRRFWPVRVGTMDLDGLRRHLDQLWAEAATAETASEPIALDPGLYPDAAEQQAQYRVPHPWTGALEEALLDLDGRLLAHDVWKILNRPPGVGRYEDNRTMGEAMRALGFVRHQYRVPHRPIPVWFYVRGPLRDPRDLYVLRDPVTNELNVSYSRTGDDPVADPYDAPRQGEVPL